MARTLLTALLMAALVGGLGCGRAPSEEAAELAYQELREVWNETDSSEEKARLAEDFLTTYPASERAARLVPSALYHLGDVLGRPQEAYDLAARVLEATRDPERRFSIAMAMRSTAADLGRPVDLASIVADLSGHRPLLYSEHTSVVEAAFDEGLWDLALSHGEAAHALATEAAFRADNPDREQSAEDVSQGVARRQGVALAAKGWALANLGRVEEALELFEAADRVTPRSYLGVPDSDLPVFWGRTLLARGEHEGAIELLAPAAIFGATEGAMEALRESYTAREGSDAGFDDYLWQSRQRHARVIDDAMIADYDGRLRSLADIRQDRAMLLAFWFPT